MDIFLQCISCNSQLQISKEWAIKHIGCDKYSSYDDVLSRLARIKNKLKCKVCKAKNVEVLSRNIDNSTSVNTDTTKRYVNTGISGPSPSSGGAGWISGAR